MLDAFIIEEIKRRERDRAAEIRPVVELPLPQPPPQPAHRDDNPPRDPGGGGVVIIDYT